MGTSRGASMPRRILPRSMSTTVIQMFSPMKIFSPSFRLRTNMSLPSIARDEHDPGAILRYDFGRRELAPAENLGGTDRGLTVATGQASNMERSARPLARQSLDGQL